MAPGHGRATDEHELQACVRDLVALSTMPSWWIGRPSIAIAESLRDLLVSMLRADSVYVQLHDRAARETHVAVVRAETVATDAAASHGRNGTPHSGHDGAVALRLASLPIGLDGELGRLEVGSSRPRFPERLELLLMQVAANHVAVALQYAELLLRHERGEQQLGERAAQQAAVARIGMRALREPSVERILTEAVAAIRETLRADHCEIFQLESDGETLLMRVADGWPEDDVGHARLSATAETEPGYALATFGPVVVRDLRRDERFSRSSLLHAQGIVSGVSVLIHCPNGVFGVLGVHSNQPRDFTDDDVHFLQSVANVLAAALERHRIEGEREELLASTAAAQAAAERASSVKSEFLGLMSHELRTPLNAIGGYVQLLEDELRGPITSEQRADLGRIRRAQRHLLSVIANVLGFLKLSSGRIEYDIQNIAVDEIVVAAEEIMRPLIAAKRLMYGQRVVGDHLRVRADRDKLQQIVLNLLSNATKFTDPGGRVEVYCAAANERVDIRVADSGSGIPSDRLESVFEPFTQVGSREKRSSEGTGLGLAISRDFAVGMGGQLLVESELGKGSTFTVVLPRAP
jgi:signal transduction histidine kinase